MGNRHQVTQRRASGALGAARPSAASGRAAGAGGGRRPGEPGGRGPSALGGAPAPSRDARAGRPARGSRPRGRQAAYRPGQLDSAYVAAFRPQRRRKPWGVIVAAVLAVALIGGGVAWGVSQGAFQGIADSLRPLIPGAAAGNDGAPASESAAADPAAASSDAVPADTAAPAVAENVVMTLDGAADTYVLVGEDFLDGGCHAYDTAARKPLATEVSGTVDTQTPGDYAITYTATDEAGAQAAATRMVHVVENFDDFDGKAETLPVLMYHYIYTEDDPPAEEDANYLLDTKFEKQLAYLAEHGYYYPSYAEVRAFAEGTHTLPARSVVLTFDDGQKGFLKYGVPLLERYKVPATSFIICSQKGTKKKLQTYADPYVQFQSHSYNMHRDGSDVGRGGIIHALATDEIVKDLKKAQKILGTTEAFAYPYGDNNENAWAAMEKADVLCAFTVENRRVKPGDNPYALPRVRIAGEYTQEGFEYLVEPNGGEQ